MKLKVGDFVTIWGNNNTLHKVLKVNKITKHFLYYDDNYGDIVWERYEWIYSIHETKEIWRDTDE